MAGEKGFTLLELLIAITILAVGMLATASMLSSGMGSDSFAYTVTVERSIAASVIEEIMAKDGGDPMFAANVANAVYDLDTGSPATTRTVQGRTYAATYSVTTAAPVIGVSRVDVTVASGLRSVTLTTYKSTI
jgi:type IV pilus assembly protein PilV